MVIITTKNKNNTLNPNQSSDEESEYSSSDPIMNY